MFPLHNLSSPSPLTPIRCFPPASSAAVAWNPMNHAQTTCGSAPLAPTSCCSPSSNDLVGHTWFLLSSRKSQDLYSEISSAAVLAIETVRFVGPFRSLFLKYSFSESQLGQLAAWVGLYWAEQQEEPRNFFFDLSNIYADFFFCKNVTQPPVHPAEDCYHQMNRW